MMMNAFKAKTGRSVSAVIPAFNAEDFILRSLESVAGQNEIPEEVIVVDDGSSDSTFDMVNSWAKNHRQLNVSVVKQQNGGVSAARNAGILKSSGDLVALLDADDEWRPEHLSTLKALFDTKDNTVVVFGDQETVLLRDESTITSCLYNLGLQEARKTVLGSQSYSIDSSIYATLISGNYIPTSASLILRTAAIDAGLYDTGLTTSEDRDLLLRLSRLGGFSYTTKILARKYDQHGHNLTDASNNLRSMTNSFLVVAKQLRNASELKLVPEEKRLTRMVLRDSAEHLMYSASRVGPGSMIDAARTLLSQAIFSPILNVKYWFRVLVSNNRNPHIASKR